MGLPGAGKTTLANTLAPLINAVVFNAPSFDPQKPTALFIGQYQPFHLGHQRLIEVGLQRVGQVCVAVRDTHGIDGKNPLPFFAVKQRIETSLSGYVGRFVVVPLPNITNVFYGRDVGYDVEQMILDEETEAISATNVRNISGLHGAFDATS
jgi:cytidyltransferase-like protein